MFPVASRASPQVPKRTSWKPRTAQKLIRAFLRAAQSLPAADLLPATTRRGTLPSDLLLLELSLDSDDFDLDRTKLVLNAALADHLDDTLIWGRVYDAVTQST